jgi:hypothetical protein
MSGSSGWRRPVESSHGCTQPLNAACMGSALLDQWTRYEDRWDLLHRPTSEIPVLLPLAMRALMHEDRIGLPDGHPWQSSSPTRGGNWVGAHAAQTGIASATDERPWMNDAMTVPEIEAIPEDPVQEAHRAMEADIERLTRSAEISRKIGRSAHRITFALGPAAIVAIWIFKPPLVFSDDFFSATAQVAVALLIAAIVEGGLASQRSTKLKRELDAEAERMSDREFLAELALGRASNKEETARARLDDAEESGRGKQIRRERVAKLIQRENEAASCAGRLIRIQGRRMRLRVEAAERDRQRSSVYSLVGLNIVWFLVAEGVSLFALLNDGDSFLAVTAALGIWLSTATLAWFLANRLDDFESELAADDTR